MSSHLYARFCGDKDKLHHQKIMRTLLGLHVNMLHLPIWLLAQMDIFVKNSGLNILKGTGTFTSPG